MRHRRLNLKLLAGLFLGVLLLTAGIFTVHRLQVHRNAAALLTLAEQARSEGNLHEAARLLRRYVRLRPDDADGYALWANAVTDLTESTEATSRDVARASAVLEEAVRAAPERDDLRKRLVDFSMAIGRFQDAQNHLDILIERQPENTELQVLYARCLIAAGRYQTAAKHFYRLIGYDSAMKTFDPQKATGRNAVDAYVLAAELLRRHLESPEQGDQIMDQLVVMNADSFRAYLQRGRYLQRRGETAAAKRDIARAFELQPDDAEVLLAAADVALDDGDFALAEKHLHEGMAAYPSDERMYQAAATLQLRWNSDVAKALASVSQGLAERPNSSLLLSYQVYLQLRNSDVTAARASIQKMRHTGLDPDVLDYLDARVLVVERNWIEAARELSRLRPLMARSPETLQEIDLLLGQCYERLGQWDQALEAYRLALAGDARLHAARDGVERMLAATGQARPRVSDVLEQRLNEMLSQPEQQRDWTSFESWLDQFIISRKIADDRSAILRAEVLLLQERFDESAALLQTALEEHPQEPRLWLAAANVAQRHPDHGPAAAAAVLDRATKEVGDRVDFRLAKGMLLVVSQDDALPAKLQELSENLSGFTSAQRQQLLRGMAAIYSRARLHDDAKHIWQSLAAELPNDLPVRVTLFELARDRADDAGMQEALEMILDLVGTREDSTWQYCQAVRLVVLISSQQTDSSRLPEAQRLVSSALRARPQWHELHRLQGMIHVMEHHYDAAIESFYRTVELGPAHPATVRQLVGALSVRGRLGEAQKALELLDLDLRKRILPELQAVLHLRSGNLVEALESAEHAVKRDPDNPAKHLWHGQILQRAGETERAESAIRRAIDLKPASPEARLALVQLLVTSGRSDQAAGELEQAKARVPKRHLALLLARGYELINDDHLAEQHYLAALRDEPDDLSLLRAAATFYLKSSDPVAGTRHAKAILDKMLTGLSEHEFPNENVAWARRTKAQLLAAGGTYQDLLAAMKLIEANSVDGRARPDDLVLSAMILARRPEAVSRRQAIRLLEQVQQLRRLAPVEQLTLAQLYRRSGEWLRCREQMFALVAQHAVDPSVLAAFCQMLLEENQVDQAERWVRKLESLQPDAETTHALQAALLAKQGSADEAAKLLSATLPESPTVTDAAKLVAVAFQLERIGQLPAAEKLLRQAARIQPRLTLQLARFIGQHGRVEEAFALLDETADQAPGEAVVQVAVLVLRARRDEVGKRFDARVEAWLAGARQAADTTALLMQEAALRDVQDDHVAEERAYRRLLARPDLAPQQRALVLNNLAFALAMRNESLQESKQLINEAITIQGPTGALLDTRAVVSWSRGEYDRAMADLNLAIADRPKATRYFHLALAQFAAGDKQAARSSYLEARRRGFTGADASGPERNHHDRLVRELGISAANAS